MSTLNELIDGIMTEVNAEQEKQASSTGTSTASKALDLTTELGQELQKIAYLCRESAQQLDVTYDDMHKFWGSK